MPPDSSLIDVLWILITAAFVMTMQAGFCLLETGSARAKSSINVAIKNLLDFCIASIVFWAVGFGLMFGDSYGGWIGTSQYFVGSDASPQLFAFLFFQLVFCGTATTIISGAVAERIRFGGYLVIASVTSLVFYPLFGHWAWGGAILSSGNGWLKELGFIDFAGSSVVHSMGGWLALAAAIVIGPRTGRFDRDMPPIHGHNLALSTVGCLILWFGWLGFNGGSTLSFDGSVPRILLNTNLAAAAGGLAGLGLGWIRLKRGCVTQSINGVLAGLVAITANCHLSDPWQAVLIGLIGGVVSVYGSVLLEKLRIDDVVGAVPVHALAGAWGTFAVALVVDPNAPSALGFWTQMGSQVIGILVCCLFGFGGGWCLFYVINRIASMRVSLKDELVGLNIAEHGAHTESTDLLRSMENHRMHGDFTRNVPVEPHTEVGQIAMEYNRVLSTVNAEIKSREKAMVALKQAEQNYREIFENCVEGIFQTSPEGSYLRVNQALATIYGYESPEELRRSISNVGSQLYVDPNRRDEFKTILDEYGIVEGFESEINTRDGSTRWISESARAIYTTDGLIERYEGTVVDITETLKLNELRRDKEAADASNAAKSAFLACMSHEIRTPLNGVIGMLDLLTGTEMSSQQSYQIKVARRSAGTLLTLINDLLDLSKIEAGKMELESVAFDLSELVNEVIDMLRFRSNEKKIGLQIQYDPNVTTFVRGDPERLRQILINLVNNAIKFTSQGCVTIAVRRTSDDGERVRFLIHDTGIGIPEDRRDRLFSPFMQVDAATTRKYGGTGLGLSICKQLVELMNGRIDVESEIGKGSTFWFEVSLPEAEGIADEDREILPKELERLRVLVIDDNTTNLDILESMLIRWGLRATTLDRPVAAVAEIRNAMAGSDPYRLVMVDQHMPGKCGLELIEEMRDALQFAQVPIVLLSSDGSPEIQNPQALEHVAAFLRKPILQSKLFETVVDCLRASIASAAIRKGDPRASTDSPLGRVLLAEDNEINQAIATQLLEDAGWCVDIVENGRLAIERLDEREYDVVIMDCQMPVMGGLEASQEIRRRERLGNHRWTAPLAIVAFTANASDEDRQSCLAAGMTAYATKPIVTDQFLRTIFECMTFVKCSSYAVEESAAIDWQELKNRCLGNEAMVTRISDMFREKLLVDLLQLSESAKIRDHSATARQAHALRGAAANTSAKTMALLFKDLEDWGKSQSHEPIEAIIAQLQMAANRCIHEIESRWPAARSTQLSSFDD